MKALSIRQPWAWLILHAGKDIENRSWYSNYRGPVLVHASKGLTKKEYLDALDFIHQDIGSIAVLDYKDLERGGIVGMVEIVDCVRRSTSPWFFGQYGFVLANPEPLGFRPCAGKLGFFTP